MSTISKKIERKKSYMLLEEALSRPHNMWIIQFGRLTVKALNKLERKIPGAKHLIRTYVDVKYEHYDKSKTDISIDGSTGTITLTKTVVLNRPVDFIPIKIKVLEAGLVFNEDETT